MKADEIRGGRVDGDHGREPAPETGPAFEVALTVESLRQAENLYTGLFGLRVAARDRGGGADGGEHGPCPPNGAGPGDDPRHDFRRSLLTGPGGRAAEECGLRLLLLLGYVETAAAACASGRVAHVGMRIGPETARRVRDCAAELGCRILADGDGTLVVEDPLGVRWRLTESG